MDLLDKIDSLIKSDSNKLIIGITGAGGKTSTMIALGQYYRDKGNKVLLSTTTKVQSPRFYNFEVNHVFIDESEFFNHTPKNGESVLFVEKHIMNAKKAIAPRDEILSIITNNYDVVIFEADGARCLPCKIHSDRDPVITKDMNAIIAMVGLSSYAEMAANVVMGEDSTKIVDINYYQNLIDEESGLLKGINENHKAIIFFNQCDLIDEKVAHSLKNLNTDYPIVIGSIEKNITI